MKINSLFCLFIAVFLSIGVRASHISGGDFAYECIGPDTYVITLNLFRDCSGISMSTAQTVTFNSTCGDNFTASLPLIYSIEISQLCTPQLPNSTCGGGTLPGMEHYLYRDTVTLISNCNFWTLSWSTCCRNSTVNVPTSSGDDVYLQATLNNLDYPCNNSPMFTAQPIPYVCQGVPITYSFGVYDADGDSLRFSFIAGMQVGAVPLTYTLPYTATNPINGITIDPLTGLINFTASSIGNFIVAVLVEQYDRTTGTLIGTVMRDIQFVVIACSTQPPDPASGIITNFSGSATNPGSYAIEMCEGDNFCFDLSITDPDLTDSLTLTSNISSVLPGSPTFNWVGGNPATAQICWNAPPGSPGSFYSVVIVAEDNTCPISNQQTYVYTIEVFDRTTAGPDITICGTQTANIQALGGATFNWSVLSGDPIVIGTNFTCNPCSNPVATPNNTTTYVVVSDLSNTCINSDTITVFNVVDFNFTLIQDTLAACLNQPVQFNITPSPSGAYSYSWDPPNYLDDGTFEDPVASIPIPGYYEYIVQVTSPDGCIKYDTAQITISPFLTPTFQLNAMDSAVCLGDSTQLWVIVDTIPVNCDDYSLMNVPFAPIAGSGTAVSLSDDQVSTSLNIGFNFKFFCNFYSHFYISSNGFITFSPGASSGCCSGQLLPDAFDPNNLIAFAWEDLNPSSAGSIEYFTTGTAPNRISIINFIGVPHYGGSDNVTVQVQLYETTNAIEIHTTNMTSDGGNHTMGIENIDGTVAFTVPGRNATSWSATNEAWRIYLIQPPTTMYYSWTPSASSLDPSNDSTLVIPPAPTTYTITVTDSASGCATVGSVSVDIYPGPNIDFIFTPDNNVAPVSVDFTNTSDPSSVNYYWQFGDSIGYSSLTDPSYLYNEPGSYTVWLYGETIYGCPDSISHVVTVLDEPIIIIPNVFSPNGDNVNDLFIPTYKGVASIEGQIVNRWGNKIYSWTGFTDWWDGGKQPEGTYYYIIKAIGNNGESVDFSGTVTLLKN